MAEVTVTADGQACIASGVVLADAEVPFELLIVDGEERLRLRCRFVEDPPGSFKSGEPGVSFAGVDAETAVIVFANVLRGSGGPLSFGPLAVATFAERGLSLIFHVRHTGSTVEMLYSFWLRTD